MTEDTLDEQLEAGAQEGLAYLRTALRTGDFKPELLQAARFLLEIKLAHDHQHGEQYVYTSDEEDEELGVD